VTVMAIEDSRDSGQRGGHDNDQMGHDSDR
jgi:hypothetical protein